jgi:four helix bundle protein
MKEKIKSFRDLVVWQKAHHLVLEIYRITKGYPLEEKFGLVSQMRRAAISVPANIAEGFRKYSKRDKINFYNIAQGSLDELHYYAILSKDLGYISESNSLIDRIQEVGKMLFGLANSVSKGK